MITMLPFPVNYYTLWGIEALAKMTESTLLEDVTAQKKGEKKRSATTAFVAPPLFPSFLTPCET